MIIPHYYEDPHTLHVGTMPNMPAPTKPTARTEKRAAEHSC